MSLALVTGANRGIGLEFCKQLKDTGFEVVALCRKSSDELKALEVRTIEDVDVTDLKSLAVAKATLGQQKISLLINNAGIMKRTGFPDVDWEAMETQYQVNAMGPLKVCSVFESNLDSGSKVALITSRMGSIADNISGGSYGYRASKAALNMIGVSLAHDLKSRGISVGLFHPGYVRTRMTSESGNLDPSESVKGLLAGIEKLNADTTGTFWHSSGEKLPW